MIFPWACLAAAATLAFWPSLHGAFLNWDDLAQVAENPHIGAWSARNLRWMFTSTFLGNYQPLTWASWALDRQIWKSLPLGFHGTNILLHIFNAFLFFSIAERLQGPARPSRGLSRSLSNRETALLAALFFAVHPLRVESVAWISGRGNLLAAFFLLACVRWLLEEPDPKATAWGFLCFILSLLSKAWAVALPPALLIMDVHLKNLPAAPADWLKPKFRPLWRRRAPFWILSGLFAALALKAKMDGNAMDGPAALAGGFLVHLKQAGSASFHYLFTTLWPARLSPLYEFPRDAGAASLFSWAAAAAALAVTLAGLVRFKKYPAASSAWLVFLIFIAPVSGLFQSGPQFAADRYTYLACLPWALVFGSLSSLDFFPAAKKTARRAARISAWAILAVLLVIARHDSRDWTSSERLWSRAVRLNPESSQCLIYLAGARLQKGDLPGAEALAEEALRKNPRDVRAWLFCGELEMGRSNPARAFRRFFVATQLAPGLAEGHEGAGRALLKGGTPEAALPFFRKAAALKPGDWEALCEEGAALLTLGRLTEAEESLLRAEALYPDSPDVQNDLGIAALRQGRMADAKTRLERAIDLKPDFAEAYFHLGLVSARTGNKDEARRLFLKTLELSPAFPEARRGIALLDS